MSSWNKISSVSKSGKFVMGGFSTHMFIRSRVMTDGVFKGVHTGTTKYIQKLWNNRYSVK